MIKNRTILGIDPGTLLLGYGVIRINDAGKPEFVDMGVLDMRRMKDMYRKLEFIHEKVGALCELHHPTDMAVESPFFGKDAQVLLKLGRAQGAAMIAAISRGIAVTEYAPRLAKMVICGNGAASKEQVSLMTQRTLGINFANEKLDATDALAIAMCHYYQLSSPLAGSKSGKSSSWEAFVRDNPGKIKK